MALDDFTTEYMTNPLHFPSKRASMEWFFNLKSPQHKYQKYGLSSGETGPVEKNNCDLVCRRMSSIHCRRYAYDTSKRVDFTRFFRFSNTSQ